jgi:oxygen-independent coproporphyrinogen-3 oxidase
VPGEESRHNQIYWRYGDYLGIGPGAHGRITLNGKKYASEHVRSPRAWLDGKSRETRTALDNDDLANEFLVMGLRLYEGIDLSRLETITKRPIYESALSELGDDGWIQIDDRRLRVTDKGMPLLNAIIAKLSDILVSV